MSLRLFSILTALLINPSYQPHFLMNRNNTHPPVAKKIPHRLVKHGDVRIDNYYWMKDRNDPAVISHLERENTYFNEMTTHLEPLRNTLFGEMKSRLKEDDSSVPVFKNGYYYQTRFTPGQQYPVYVRWAPGEEDKAEILADVNEMAKGHEYYHLTGLNISPDNRYAAFGIDTVGRRLYTIYIKDLISGKMLTGDIPGTTGHTEWANDSKTLFYVVKNPVTLRSERIRKHIAGTDVENDKDVYYEEDETFGTSIAKSKSGQFIFIQSYSTLSTEYRYLDAGNPEGDFIIFQPREKDLEYGLAHVGDRFFILTNIDGAKNFKIMTTPIDKTGKEHWKDYISHRDDILIEDITEFEDYLVLEERRNGLLQIRILRFDGTAGYLIPFDEETYTVSVFANPEMQTDVLRFAYNSLTTPTSVFDFNMTTRTRKLMKTQEIPGGYDPEQYTSERLWITARDGKKVAVSLVRRNDTPRSPDTPLLLYGYGSYGYTVDPRFSTSRLSLLDRGFIFAIAHIRGGEYLGRAWYEDGKLLNKKNTFYDFIDAAKALVQMGYTSPQHLYAEGGSAGGLLMGAVINMEPGLFHGVIAAVPFVDVLTTMLDDSIPLTTSEYDEWGNPDDEQFYHYIKSYSPYDNVERKDYPNLLVTTGLHDSQVQYFEPAKWVAKLREYKTDDNLLLLYIDMDSGHGGASGRYNALKDIAREYAFIIGLEMRE